MQSVQSVLAIVGVIALGLPALLRAILVFLNTIPGNQGEVIFEKALAIADKIGNLVRQFYPAK